MRDLLQVLALVLLLCAALLAGATARGGPGSGRWAWWAPLLCLGLALWLLSTMAVVGK